MPSLKRLNSLKSSGLYLILFFFIPVSLTAQNATLEYEKNQVFVKVHDIFYSEMLEIAKSNVITEKRTLIPEITFTEIKQLSKINDPELKKVFKLTFDNKHNIEQVIKQLEATQKFEYVEKAPIYQLFHTPNDLDSRQWHLKKVEAEKAWDITRGNCPVVIAVIDDAIDTLHPDLRPVIWKNMAEIPGNGIDDDGNGYVDDFLGWNAASNNNDPTPPSNVANRFFDHGTHCAGIAGAQSNNGVGIASVGYDIQLMAIKVGYDMGGGRAGLRNLYEGIEYAIVNKANVVTMSLGGPGRSVTINNLINYGESKGITFVAAAGNNNTQTPMFPAAYSAVISVAASDSFDRKASFTTYGSWIDITAPGVDIYSTLPYSPGYGYKSGTSMACPLVASTIALMICKNPNIKPSEIKNCLKSRADDISTLNPNFIGLLGTGRMNVFKSVACVKNIIAAFSSNKREICPGQSVQFLQEALPFPQTVSWRFVGGIPFASNSFNPTVQHPNAGKYSVEMIVGDGTSFDTLFLSDYIIVEMPTAVISGNRSVAKGSYTNIRVDLKGKAPFELEYSDGTNTFEVKGIYQNPYYIISRIDEFTSFTLVSMKDENCQGTVSGKADIDIISGGSCGPAESFTKISGSNTPEEGVSSCYSDGYIYVGGFTSSNSFGGEDALLNKYDTAGNLVWSKVYGGSGNDRILTMAIDSNKNIIMGGSTTSYGSNPSSTNGLILLVDTSGTVLGSKVYATTAKNDVVCIRPTTDRGYILGGYNMFSSGNSQGYVLKIDSNLNHQWGRQSVSGNSFSLCLNVEEIPGVGYYATHMHRVGTLRFDNILAKYSYNGAVQWYKGYGGDFNDAFRGLVVGPNNELFVYSVIRISNTNLDLVLMKVDTSGNILAASRFHTPNFEEAVLNSIFIDSNSLYAIGMTRTSISTGNWDGKLLKLSFNGEIEWQTGIGTPNFEEIKSISISENNIFFTGYIDNSRFGGKDILFSKIGCNGVNNCLTSDIFYTRDTMSIKHYYSNTNPTIVNVNNLSNINSIGAKSINLNNESLCIDCESNGSITYSKVLADSNLHTPKALYKSHLGSYTLSVSSAVIFGSSNSAVYVVKTNLSGSIEWSIKLNSQNFEGKGRIEIIEGNDGSIYISSNTSSSSSLTGNMFITKLNAQGAHIWSKQFSTGSGEDLVSSLLVDNNHNIYFTASLGLTASTGNVLLTKLDSSGAILWQTNVNSSAMQDCKKIVNAGSGIFYALIHSNIGTGSANPLVLKFDSTGAIHWSKLITYSGSSIFVDMARGSNSQSLVLVGYGNTNTFGGTDFLLASFDTALVMQWSKYYGGTAQEQPVSISSTNDGYIIAGNSTSFDNGTLKQVLFTVDLNGNLGWTKIYGNQRFETKFIQSTRCLQIDSSTYNIYHISRDSSLGFGNISLTRLDNCANSFCYFSQVLMDEKTFNPSPVTTQPFSLATPPTLSNLAMNWATNQFSDTFLCSFIPKNPEIVDTCIWSPDINYEGDCVHDPVTLQDVSIIPLAQIFSRKWFLGNGEEVYAGQTFKYKYDSPGSYMVKLEITGINSNNNICQGIDSIAVVVPDELYVEFVDTITICASDSAVLENTRMSCWELPIRAKWTPNIALSDTSKLEPKASPFADQWYYVTVTDRSGKEVKDSVFVKIDYSCCQSHASFSHPKEIYCLGDSIAFTNTSNALSNASYAWDFGPGSVSGLFIGANPPKQVFKQTGSHFIYLSLSDDCGVDTFVMEIFILDNPYLGFATDTVLCFPDTIQIGGPAVSRNDYIWTPIVDSDNTVSNPVIIANKDTVFVVTMIDDLTQCSVSDTIKITGFELKKVLGNDTTICNTTSLTLDVSGTGSEYLWNTGEITPQIQVNSSGKYKVLIKESTCTIEDSITISVEKMEDLSFSLPADTGFCDLSPYLITPNKTLSNPIWKNGLESQQITDINGGLYWLEERGVACTFRDSIFVDRKELPVFSLGSDTFICENKTVTLESDIDLSSLNRVWDNGENTLSRTVSSPGTYKLKVDNGICSYEDSVEVSLKRSPVIDLPSDTTLCKGDTLFLNSFHPDINQYLWQLTSSSPEYQITQPGIYSLFTSSICLDTTYLINVEEEYCDCEVYVPSAFSPNSDNVNEIFITSFCELQQFKMEIFDRWGGKLFETNDIFEGWNGKRNGKLLPAGSYLYVITLQRPSYNKGNTYKKSGTVNLIY